MQKPIHAYRKQRYGAKRRGIRWRFTFQDWVAWWEGQLGPDWFKKRGCVYGKYVMARYEDNGPYSLSNVKCILHTDNIQERDSSKKLSPDQIREIFLSKESRNQLAKRYNIHPTAISHIRKYRIGSRYTRFL